MKYIHLLDARPENFEGELMDMLYTASEKAKMTMIELQNYDKTMYTELDRLAQLEYAKEEGLEKGREEGRNDALLEIARKMKAAGADPAFIKEMTGIEL